MIRRGLPSTFNRVDKPIKNSSNGSEKVVVSEDFKEEIVTYSKLDTILQRLDKQSKQISEIKNSFSSLNKTIDEIKNKNELKMVWILIAVAIALSSTSTIWVRFFM